MATSVGDVAITVGADVAPLAKGLKKGADDVTQFAGKSAKQLKSLTTTIAKMGAAAGAVAVGGLLQMTKSATATGRELKVMAQIANTTTTQFQKMAFGANSLGIENDKLADILKDVNDRVGDFLTTGGGPMADFFEKIAPKVGVTAEQFRKLSGPQALQLYVDSLEKANLSQGEMTFFLEAMASDLTQLQPLLANNGKLLQEQAERAEKLGLVLSEIELEQLEEGAKAFAQLKKDSEAAALVIGSKLSPFVVEAVKQFEKLSETGGDFGDSVDSAIRKTLKGIGFLGDMIQGLKVVFKGVELVVKGFGAAVVSVFEVAATVSAKFIDDILAGVNVAINALNKLPKVDIANIDPFKDSAFIQGFHNLGDTARNEIRETRTELALLAEQELPSAKIESFLQAVTDNSIKAAAAVVEAKAKIGELTNPEGLSEEEQKRVDRETAEKEHLDRMVALNKNSGELINGFIKNQWGNNVSNTVGGMRDMVKTLSTGSRKAFEISKAWAMTDAAISMYQGIAKGVSLGWPMGVPAVAWATATGLSQINAIKNQSFGGAGGAAASGNGTPATAPNPIGVGGSAATGGAQGQAQTLNVAPIDPNAIFSGASMQAFGEQILEFTEDGGQVVFQA